MGVQRENFNFSIVTEEEILKLLKGLNVSKATGCDKVSAKFLKDGTYEIVEPLTYIINLSLRTQTVPDDLKEARVVPLFKKGDKNVEGYYRPVSILPVISKLLERIVHNQVYFYLGENNMIYKQQSGFRQSFSTKTTLTFLTDSIRFNTDNGFYTGLVLIDLQKAFDTVDHELLLTKLCAIGFNKSTVSWFKSYLSNRAQYVDVNGSISSRGNLTCGVPQGSILGPLLFLIYVNDMVTSVDCDLYLYADDSTLMVKGKDIKEIVGSKH